MNSKEIVNKESVEIPEDYHCDCEFCQKDKFLGLLIKPDGTYYNKNERNKYYSKIDKNHIARTPLHLAKYLIQNYTEEDDWVLDSTVGSGTSIVEAVKSKRNGIGIEINEEYSRIARENVRENSEHRKIWFIINGDARKLRTLVPSYHKVSLIISNPPYSGDEREGKAKYDKNDSNLAFLRENESYYKTIKEIYKASLEYLKPGGYFAIGVKDMMRKKQPYLLHRYLGVILEELGLTYQGMILLPHYPATLFMNTYQKRYPEVEKIPRYQTILIFKKEGSK